jgi:two-component system sensor histidine kinase CpxA
MERFFGVFYRWIPVRDFGPGIPEKLKERIFDPFFRADASGDEQTGGVGLGRAIAQRAARVHHGDIAATNASPGAFLTIMPPLHPEAQQARPQKL